MCIYVCTLNICKLYPYLTINKHIIQFAIGKVGNATSTESLRILHIFLSCFHSIVVTVKINEKLILLLTKIKKYGSDENKRAVKGKKEVDRK